MNCQAHEVLGLAHQQRQAKALAQPAGEPDMVGMVMRDQNARERDVAVWVGEQRLYCVSINISCPHTMPAPDMRLHEQGDSSPGAGAVHHMQKLP